jgi:uncharacterized protein YkwD
MRSYRSGGVPLAGLALVALALGACEGIGLLSSGEVGEGPAVTPEGGGSTDPGNPIDDGHPTVGRVFSGSQTCSGTLVGSRTVLTAGQCVEGTSASFVLGEKSHASSKVVRHPDFKGPGQNDLALVILGAPVGVTVSTISAAAPTVGLIVTLVGHENASKRMLSNTVASLNAISFAFAGAASSCSGDLGGPSFVKISGTESLIGVHTTRSSFCGASGIDSRVDYYNAWMNTASGGDVPSASGSTPPPVTPPPAGTAKEGESCTAKACGAGLTCVGVYNGQTKALLGKYCMESCTTLGADPACDGGETCTKSPQGTVCFNGSSPSTGFTSNGSTPPPTNPTVPPATGCGSAEETEVVNLLNQERANNGLSALSCDAKGITVARAHSQDMCDRGYFSHYTPEGKAPWDRLSEGGVQFSSAGENIAMGYSTPQAVHTGWMNSSGHRENMLTPNWTRVGVGMIRCKGTTPYWTEVFMR